MTIGRTTPGDLPFLRAMGAKSVHVLVHPAGGGWPAVHSIELNEETLGKGLGELLELAGGERLEFVLSGDLPEQAPAPRPSRIQIGDL